MCSYTVNSLCIVVKVEGKTDPKRRDILNVFNPISRGIYSTVCRIGFYIKVCFMCVPAHVLMWAVESERVYATVCANRAECLGLFRRGWALIGKQIQNHYNRTTACRGAAQGQGCVHSLRWSSSPSRWIICIMFDFFNKSIIFVRPNFTFILTV